MLDILILTYILMVFLTLFFEQMVVSVDLIAIINSFLTRRPIPNINKVKLKILSFSALAAIIFVLGIILFILTYEFRFIIGSVLLVFLHIGIQYVYYKTYMRIKSV